MPTVISTGRSGPGNVTPPLPGTGNGGLVGALLGARYGGGPGLGNGAGFDPRLLRGVRRKPGIDPYTDPSVGELPGGGAISDPESFFSPERRFGSRAIFSGRTTTEPIYDLQGRTSGTRKVTMGAGDWGYQNPNPGIERLREYSSALGAWRGRPGSIGGVNQGAAFGQPDDAIRRLLMARMGGGGL